ncbi:MAG: AAA family ATPase [Nannocystaceae bacterium]
MRDTPHARLRRALAAGARALWIDTAEEERALRLIEAVGDDLDRPVHTWSVSRGCDDDGLRRPLADLLGALARGRESDLWILLDGAPALADPAALRALREIGLRTDGPAAIVVGPAAAPEAAPELLAIDLPLPDPVELREHLRDLALRLGRAGPPGVAAALDADADDLARLGLGLPLRRFDRLIREAVLARGADSAGIRAHVVAHKPDALGHAGLLARVDAAPRALLGGLEGLKRWLERRALALDPLARRAAIPEPRGVLLVGVQGCGKSLAARVAASILDLPIVRLEPGRLFGGTVGESERNLREVTGLVDRLAPIVLWIDEIERGLAGGDAPQSDGGTAARVVGGLLTWMQERARPVFVVATANGVDHLPPELVRRGRFDEVFFVDLPDANARRAIARVHLETWPKRQLGEAPPIEEPLAVLLDLAGAAEGFSGAEIEAAITEARLDAFAEGRPLSAVDLERALAATVPLSRARREAVEGLRRWAEGGARRA